MGKVHGSLARAGKVKAATPKVRFFFTFFLSSCPFLDDIAWSMGWIFATEGQRGRNNFPLEEIGGWIFTRDSGRYNKMNNKC